MREQAIPMVEFGNIPGSGFKDELNIAASRRPIHFGKFRIFPGTRSLEYKGRFLELGSRAFDLLMVLLKSRGQVVAKEEIMRYVWPTTVVEEANLRVQMTSLRRVLGCDRNLIKTVSGRGYMAAADEEFSEAPVTAARAPRLRTSATSSVDGKPSIVIIDRNAENREAIHRLLQPFNADVRSFVSVEAFFISRATSAQGSDAQQDWR